eukprot:SAG31_NODE_9620_length_1249_cov_14.382609_1_plen_81_part_00
MLLCTHNRSYELYEVICFLRHATLPHHRLHCHGGVCELGVISVGADGVISAAAPPAEIAHYDDGKMQTLIDSQISIDDLF